MTSRRSTRMMHEGHDGDGQCQHDGPVPVGVDVPTGQEKLAHKTVRQERNESRDRPRGLADPDDHN